MKLKLCALMAFVFLTGLTVLSGCERVKTVVVPDDTEAPMADATLKIGVIQPSNIFSTFSQGAETARPD